FAKFMQEVVGLNEKGILLQDSADDDHRMSPHDVDHRVSSKFRQMISADDSIFVTTPYVIHARFELNNIVHVRPSFDGPVHAADNAVERVSCLGAGARQALER